MQHMQLYNVEYVTEKCLFPRLKMVLFEGISARYGVVDRGGGVGITLSTDE